jgi:hypothetical protein
MKRWFLSLALLAGLAAPALGVVSQTSVGDAAYTILQTDQRVFTSTAFSAARIWTLPAAGATCVGQTCPANSLEILDPIGAISSTNTLTITPASGDTINGSSASIVINTPYTRVLLTPVTGSNWSATFSASDVQVFQTAGAATWTARKGISWVQVLACGAGGGGGGGGVGVASGTAWGGGAGGGGGACIQQTYRATDLGAS